MPENKADNKADNKAESNAEKSAKQTAGRGPDAAPETGVQVELRPRAGLIVRFLAFFIDMSLVSLAWAFTLFGFLFLFLIFLGFSYFTGSIQSFSDLQTMDISPGLGLSFLAFALFLLLTLAVEAHGYFIYFEGRDGSTPGKNIFRLKVISLDGQRPTRRQVFYRDLGRWYIDGIFIFVSLVVMLLSEKRQRVGDLMAKTMVVDAGLETKSEFRYVFSDDYQRLLQFLKPRPVDAAIREQYLSFAFRSFLLGREKDEASERNRWLVFIREHLAAPSELNDLTLLRFFAEFCSRSRV